MRWGHENQEHLCKRPNVARIAVGGELGERGRYEAWNMLLRTTGTGRPPSPDRKGGVKI